MFMDKNEFIQIYSTLINKNSISIKDSVKIIEEYCKINNKDEKQIKIFIKLLINIPTLFNECLTISLQELSKHFSVNILTEIKTNKILKVF